MRAFVASVFLLLCAATSASGLPSFPVNALLGKLPSVARNGLTGDSCKNNSDCSDGRKCLLTNTVTEVECADKADTIGCECRKSEMKDCSRSSDCEDGEICVDSSNTSSQPFCFSKKAAAKDDELTPVDGPTAPNASPAAQTSDVCIAARSLAHLSQRDLVYARHRVARVLCDSSGSCATPGHIVLFHGVPMMMTSYCEAVSCVAKIMHVNSPRYTRAVRVPSLTDGLQFTAFAARYQTTTEEHLLATAIRLGL
ncbi:hypothetical protein BWQ96_07039 [Gracilariopsis chorda]|uniref:Uncharacterized protein n=1 Tax=Gracilariopsis chorda TaxID=448386 RepID=A0A2V3IQ05_9FLOR|nr:hypothetical protein BWQ96_07039 [Gracilariopsis chorda]|eukprot:PXF43210.1 hypothetical protein BWQ96_07039 [Gracilariopsis chorda]